MSADLSIRSNGMVEMFAGRGIAPWHKLGQLIDGCADAADALKLAGQDWEVLQQAVQYMTPAGQLLTDRDHFVNCRSDTHFALGVVGKQYEPFQNRDAFEFMDAVIGEAGAHYDTAGCLDGGKRVWMSAILPERIAPPNAPKDQSVTYLIVMNTHDGSSSLRMYLTSVRVVCSNTWAMALGQLKRGEGIRIRHTGSLRDRVDQARKALGLVHEAIRHAQAEIAAMAAHKVNDAEAKALFASLIGKPIGDQTPTRIVSAAEAQADFASLMAQPVAWQEAKRLGISQERYILDDKGYEFVNSCLLNLHNRRNTVDGMAGTAWEAYNAVSEWCDHERPVRGKTQRDRDESRWSVTSGVPRRTSKPRHTTLP